MSPVVDNPMPLEIKQSPLTPNTVEHFKQVLRDTHVQPVVDTVVAHPATRGRGVGRALLEHAARALGSDPVVPDQCRKS